MSNCATCNGSGWRPSFGGSWDDCPCRTWTERGPAPSEPAPRLVLAVPPPTPEQARRRREEAARAKLIRVERRTPAKAEPTHDVPKPVQRIEVAYCGQCPWRDIGDRDANICTLLPAAKARPNGYRAWQAEIQKRTVPVPSWCPMRDRDVVVSVGGGR